MTVRNWRAGILCAGWLETSVARFRGAPPSNPSIPANSASGNQQVERAGAASIRKGHVQRLLPATQGAETGYGPVQTGQSQQALHQPGRLAGWHTKQHLHGQASLDRGIGETLLTAAVSGPSRDQTGSIAIRAASVRHCRTTGSWSCTSQGSNRSYTPAIILDS